MGGKTSQSTSTVSVPPEVLARYSAVNQRAEQAATQPFQIYSTDPNAFVAPLTATQQAGIANTNSAAGLAQPYFNAATSQILGSQAAAQPLFATAEQGIANANQAGKALIEDSLATLAAANQNASPLNRQAGQYYSGAFQAAQPYNQGAASLYAGGLGAAAPLNQQAQAGLSGALAGAQPYNQQATGLTLAGAQAINPEALNTGQYLSPYLGTVLGSTKALIDQQNAIQRSQLQGDQIKGGYFGGDRAGIGAANLAQQQALASGKIYSDILNQGYSQALGAAQQQQGVGLGAAQANRAALTGAAGQLAQIGQQQYGQGTGTAQAQAALGQQLFGQGLGAGQAVQGLGQQVYGQGTGTGSAVQGLGQQVFGQGLATSQQQAAAASQLYNQMMGASQARSALAGQEYGIGSNTAQQLAGLGAGAQGAALQGAQAQLGAGQAQQQTQQAGLQALYNQFLQQQSYPFQVAQFLANIAEGTGSLSGSTTTTTQPGGFFSDRRLKEDIKEVGRTFDGQPIVTYRYKDEPNVVRLGLIAQDVEKKHPEAVGEAHGFKTVDYGRATEGAAKRGHFAAGGAPYLPGLSGADMAAILQAQQEMFGGYGGAGIYGGAASGAPRGGSSYVPQANLPVSGLTVAQAAPQPVSPMEQLKDTIELADDTAEGLGKAKDWWDKRKKKADGGSLYGEGLDIPNERPDYELKTPEIPGQPKSGLGKVKDVAATALAAAKLAAMFADGGAVDDEKWNDRAANYDLGMRLSGHPERQVSGQELRERFHPPVDPASLAAAAPALIPGLGAAGVRAPHLSVRYAPSGGEGQSWIDILKRHDPGRIIGDYLNSARDPGRAIGDMLAGGHPKAAAPVMASAPAPHETRVSRPARSVRPERPTPAGLGAVSPVGEPQAAGLSPVVGAPAPAEATGLQAPDIASNIQAPREPTKLPGYLEGLKEGHTPEWVSLLAALGAAGTAPTVHPGVALAAALGAGAKSYMGAKQVEAGLAKTAAETETQRAQTQATQAEAAFDRAKTYAELSELATNAGFVLVEDPAGRWEVEGHRYSTVPKAALIKAGVMPSAASSGALGDAGHHAAQSSYLTFSSLPPNIQAAAQGQLQDIANRGAAANQQLLGLREWGTALSQMKEGPLQPGAFSEFGLRSANTFNSLVDLLPIPADAKADLKFDPTGLDSAMIARKMTTAIAQARAAGADERSLRALELNRDATANEKLTRNAALTLWAQDAVANQQAIDQAAYLAGMDEEARKISGQAMAFLPKDMQQAFWADNPPAKYDAERTKLAEMAKSPEFVNWMRWLQSGDPKKIAQVRAGIDNLYGAGMSRYLAQ